MPLSPADVAVESADIVLVRSDPRDVASIVELARATYRKMGQNLWWATGYNAVALPLAAGVLYGSLDESQPLLPARDDRFAGGPGVTALPADRRPRTSSPIGLLPTTTTSRIGITRTSARRAQTRSRRGSLCGIHWARRFARGSRS